MLKHWIDIWNTVLLQLIHNKPLTNFSISVGQVARIGIVMMTTKNDKNEATPTKMHLIVDVGWEWDDPLCTLPNSR